jgi:hypothetical protein
MIAYVYRSAYHSYCVFTISLKTMIRIPQVCGQDDGFDFDRWENFVMPKLDKQDQRIADIFGTKDIPDVTDETLEVYLEYLKQHIEMPCQVTGIESFEWEEYFMYEDGDSKEHERLRKTQPSCMDKYDLLSFDNKIDPEDGILVNVKRVSDNKMFVLALARLEATKRKSANRQLLNDYAIWFTTWGD